MGFGKSVLIFVGGMLVGAGIGVYEFLRFSAKNERIGAVVREEAEAVVKKTVAKAVKVFLTEKTVEPEAILENNELFHTVLFDTRKEAETFLAYMRDAINARGYVKVTEENLYLHRPIANCRIGDRLEGWTDLGSSFVRPYRSGYKVVMPKPKNIGGYRWPPKPDTRK